MQTRKRDLEKPEPVTTTSAVESACTVVGLTIAGQVEEIGGEAKTKYAPPLAQSTDEHTVAPLTPPAAAFHTANPRAGTSVLKGASGESPVPLPVVSPNAEPSTATLAYR